MEFEILEDCCSQPQTFPVEVLKHNHKTATYSFEFDDFLGPENLL